MLLQNNEKFNQLRGIIHARKRKEERINNWRL